MSSRKFQLLGWIKGYFAEHGVSPATREMAAAIGVSTTRVRALLRRLEAEGLIIRLKGVERGIRLPEMADELSDAEIAIALVARGWKVNPATRSATGAFPDRNLPQLPPLVHIPDIEAGNGDDGKPD
ncbi:LexA family protein [Stakelama tenebrarum]|uniref:GntR family transcriptional regulator n=1 Tax=Stakelama tenebrarum TaxID=2711215 RepID=A0A6G6Y5T8_9SPHN|nr:GntR family transcriptional regulator [Sphingosinithalassobacter tenebrarum]QIG80088.1 GntR family transcriptional regulator [Sphingosinithalassobacter tenebrarum]